jgi:endoglucanase
MLAAHMDEVGLMLVKQEGGFFGFETVGGIDLRQLPGKPVWVGRQHLPGVIGVRPIHMIPDSDRTRMIRQDQLFIDMGEAGSNVHPGDRAVFATRFTQAGPSLRSKALDDRLGVVTLIELIRHAPKNVDLLAAFTVQEEIGRRGALPAAYAFDPDAALAIDATPANDLPTHDGSENRYFNTRLDHGPVIYLADGAMIHDSRLVRHLTAAAEKHGIPFQFRQPGGGSTDASHIQVQRQGIPAVSVSVPIRYAHTSASLARLSDWQAALALVYHSLEDITLAILDR